MASRRVLVASLALVAVLGGILLIGSRSIESHGARVGNPYLGQPCRGVHRHPVTLVVDASGRTWATFALAGGAARGTVAVSAQEATEIGNRGATVSEVQLGSYERADHAGASGWLVCRLNPTWHFYCPATENVDEFCFTPASP